MIHLEREVCYFANLPNSWKKITVIWILQIFLPLQQPPSLGSFFGSRFLQETPKITQSQDFAGNKRCQFCGAIINMMFLAKIHQISGKQKQPLCVSVSVSFFPLVSARPCLQKELSSLAAVPSLGKPGAETNRNGTFPSSVSEEVERWKKPEKGNLRELGGIKIWLGGGNPWGKWWGRHDKCHFWIDMTRWPWGCFSPEVFGAFP